MIWRIELDRPFRNGAGDSDCWWQLLAMDTGKHDFSPVAVTHAETCVEDDGLDWHEARVREFPGTAVGAGVASARTGRIAFPPPGEQRATAKTRHSPSSVRRKEFCCSVQKAPCACRLEATAWLALKSVSNLDNTASAIAW